MMRICALCADYAHLRILCAYYAQMRMMRRSASAHIMRILCASAHNAHLRILRIIYDSAHIMHIICLDAHDGRMRIICAECAGYADAHIMRIMRRCALCAYA